MQELNLPWARRMHHRIPNHLWVLGRLLGRNDDPTEIQGVSRKQLKEKGMVSGRAGQAVGTAWLTVLRREGAQLIRGCLEQVSGVEGWFAGAGWFKVTLKRTAEQASWAEEEAGGMRHP